MNDKLKSIEIEDYIWIIYIGIIILSYISNSYEKKYFLFNDLVSKKKYQELLTLIFTILTIIYFYFFNSSLKDLKNLKATDSDKKKELTILSFIGSLFVLLSGLIFLYIAINDQDIDVEIAFN